MLAGSRLLDRHASSSRGSWRRTASSVVSGVPRPRPGRADGDPVAAVRGGEPEALGPARGDGEREGALQRARRAGRLVRGVVRRRHRRPGRGFAVHDRLEHLQELLEARQAISRCPRFLPERRGVRALAARAQPEVEAAAAHVIEREGVAGERHGVPEVRRGDQRAEPDACRHGRRGGEHGHRGVPWPVRHAAPADVVVGPRRAEPDAVGPLPLAAGLGPAVGGQDDEADVHGAEPTRDGYLVAVANERETKRWNDDRWVASWPNRERLTEALTPYLLRGGRGPAGPAGVRHRVWRRPPDHHALADAVAPEGRAVGLDISAPLLELAGDRARQAGAANVEFVVVDVQTGHLDQEPFDLAVSQLGVMFFDEPLVAFGAIRGLLGADGRLVFACWQGVEQNPWHLATALRALIPPPPLPAPGKSPVGPFTLGDDEYVRDVLGGAGFVGGREHQLRDHGPGSGQRRGGPLRCSSSWASLRSAWRRRRPWSSAISSGSPSGPTSTSTPGVPGLRGRQRLMAGYSGTPLPKKLGIVEGSTLALVGAPPGVHQRPACRRDREAPGPREGGRRGGLLHRAA